MSDKPERQIEKTVRIVQLRSLALLISMLGAALVLACVLVLPGQAQENVGAWRRIQTQQSPGNRSGHTMVVIDTKVYLFGGVVQGEGGVVFKNDLWVFDPATNQWSEIVVADPPPPRVEHSAVAMDGKMIIYGGMIEGTRDSLPDRGNFIYDPATNCWYKPYEPEPMPPALSYHRAVVSNGKMYLVGGIDETFTPSNQVWGYDPNGNDWVRAKDYPGDSGAYGAAVLPAGSGIIVGGTTDNDYYIYNPATDTWQPKTAGAGFPNRTSPGVATIGSTGYIFGGEDNSTGQYRSDSWRADLSQDPVNWEPGPPDMPNIQPNLIPEPSPYSPTTPGWRYAPRAPDLAILLYGRSWAYEDHTLILGEAATYMFLPNFPASGALENIQVLPREASMEIGYQQLFTADGRDANGFYVPVTPTWSGTGGTVAGSGKYIAGDLPGLYSVKASVEAGPDLGVFTSIASIVISGTSPCPVIQAGAVCTHTFTVAGVYPYYDGTKENNTGTITVVPPGRMNSGRPPAPTWDVSITSSGFEPVTFTIALNNNVRWTNNDSVVHSINGGSRIYRVYLPVVLRQ
ncbi:MAG: hypothetical protein JXA42_13170 [Anaerolineales bacterium]|nr:hypothetical protein [Anaerolineales bacterium]